jgi:hypothetical protein
MKIPGSSCYLFALQPLVERSRATQTIQLSVYRINLRRSTMSPMAPAGSAKMKNGKAEALCVSATHRPSFERNHEPCSTHALHERAKGRHNARKD